MPSFVDLIDLACPGLSANANDVVIHPRKLKEALLALDGVVAVGQGSVGAAVAKQVAVYNGVNSLAGYADLTFDPVTKILATENLTLTGTITLGTATYINSLNGRVSIGFDDTPDGILSLNAGILSGTPAIVSIDSSPSMYPYPDNSIDLGIAPFRWRTGYFGTSVAIGINKFSESLQYPASKMLALNKDNDGIDSGGLEIYFFAADINNYQALSLSKDTGLGVGVANKSTSGGVLVDDVLTLVGCALGGVILGNGSGTAYWEVGTATVDPNGPILPAANNVQDIGSDLFKVRTGYFGTSVVSPVSVLTPMTTAERDALVPANGWVIYNSTTDKFQGRAAGAWVDLN